MRALVDRVNRLKEKLTRELQTTVSYLRYHFNQRSVFQSKMREHHIMMHKKDEPGEIVEDDVEDEGNGRKLTQQKLLKDYGKIPVDLMNENFDIVNKPIA